VAGSSHVKLFELEPRLLDLPDVESGIVLRVRRIREQHVEQLTMADIAFCLRQSIAVQVMVDRAIQLLADAPLLQVEHFPGDLLVSLLTAAEGVALSEAHRNEIWDICASATAGAESIGEHVLPAIRASSFSPTVD
jgi:hypothetical protein